MPLIGEPTFSVQVRRDDDGNTTARVFARAAYADRTATAFRDDDDLPDALTKALEKLVDKHRGELELEVTGHAYEALAIARRYGELSPDGMRTLSAEERARAEDDNGRAQGTARPSGSVRARVTRGGDE